MLDIKEFCSAVVRNIKDYLSNDYCDAEIKIDEVKKNNGVVLNGLIIRTKKNISPTIYMENFYDQYSKGEKSFDAILEEIAKIRESSDIDFTAEELLDYEKAKPHIIPRLIGKMEWNENMMVNMPYVIFQDMIILFVIEFPNISNGHMSAKITNQILEQWEVTKEEIYTVAFENAKEHQMFKPTFKSMLNVLSDMMHEEPNEELLRELADDEIMFVLTNEDKTNGASVILNKNVLEGIYHTLGRIVLIPSSIHEWIICREINALDKETINQMIKDVNATQVERNEWLSDHAYIYDTTEGLRNYE